MHPRILIVSKGGVGRMMSAPGIRALNTARVLAAALPGASVTLAAWETDGLPPDLPFRAVTYTNRSLLSLAMQADIVVCQGFPPTLLPAYPGRRFVLDFFAPMMVEGLEYRMDLPVSARQVWLETQRAYLNYQLTLADFVICANERQRDAWLGMMSSLGLIPGSVYDRDVTLRKLVDVVPFGIRPEDPAPRPDDPPVIRGVVPGINPGDRVLIWNGGILRWYDPLNLIRAVARLVPSRPDVKLLFLGTKYPVAGFDPGGTLGEAYALAQSLGLFGTHVLFNDGWLPYDASGRALSEANIGVSTYYDNLESHFSFRIRLIDFLWAGLPVVCTQADVIAEMVAQRGLGIAVPERDVDALTAALARLLDDDAFAAQCRANIAAVREELRWERVMEPLIRFCREPVPAARGKLYRAPELLGRTGGYLTARVLEQVQSRRIHAATRLAERRNGGSTPRRPGNAAETGDRVGLRPST